MENSENSSTLYAKNHICTEDYFFLAKRWIAHSTDKHTHEFIQFVYVTKGSIMHYTLGREECLMKGEMVLIPPLLKHRILCCSDDTEWIYVNFLPSFVNSKFKTHLTLLHTKETDRDFLFPLIRMMRENKYPKFSISAEMTGEIEFLLNEIISAYNSKNIFYKVGIKSLLLRLLYIISTEYEKGMENTAEPRHKFKDHIMSATQYINDHFSEQISLDTIVEQSAMSQAYFVRIFKEITGKTFVQYLNDTRVYHAITLMKTSEKNLSEICFEVGFNDLNHFTRTFKKICGSVPSEYRKNCKA